MDDTNWFPYTPHKPQRAGKGDCAVTIDRSRQRIYLNSTLLYRCGGMAGPVRIGLSANQRMLIIEQLPPDQLNEAPTLSPNGNLHGGEMVERVVKTVIDHGWVEEMDWVANWRSACKQTFPAEVVRVGGGVKVAVYLDQPM